MKKFADLIIEKRLWFLTGISLITLFFIFLLNDLRVYTKFADLLPQGHEYIKVHNKIRAKFGGANTVNMLLQVKKGEIFNTTTLQKVKDITEELYLIPGVDRFKIFSLAVNSMVDMVVTSGGFDFQPMMFPDIPQTQEEMERLKGRLYASTFYGGIVWFDGKKTLITADFFEDEIDYTVVFKELRRLQEKYEDDNHILSISGEPLRIGYVDSYVWPIFRIMIITFLGWSSSITGIDLFGRRSFHFSQLLLAEFGDWVSWIFWVII
jgi:predicted RND superfamily exporter protein